MTQLSKGIRLGYGEMTGDTRPISYTFISELTGIPALGASPSTHQSTTLNDSSHVYIKGLIDVGGNLDFPCNFTNSVIDEIDVAIALQEGGSVLEWCIEFPMPLGLRSYCQGEVAKVFNESVDVDAPITGTISLVPTSVVANEEANYTIEFDSNEGSAVVDQSIKYGGLVVEPTEPTLAEVTFNGWYTDDSTFLEEFNFGSTKVTDNLVLYAEWV